MQRQPRWYREGLFALALTGALSLGQVALPSLALAEEAADDVAAAEVEQTDTLTTDEQQATPAAAPAAPTNETPTAAPAETPAETPVAAPTADPVVETPTQAPADAAPADATPADAPADAAQAPTDDPDAAQAPTDAADADQAQATTDATPDAAPAVTDPAAEPEHNDPVENGTVVFIESGASSNEAQVLDAKGGKTADGTNIQTHSLNNTAAQKYEFEKAMRAVVNELNGETTYEEDRDENGNIFYWIKRAGTEQVLTVVGNIAAKGTNVALYAKDASLDGQKWRVVDLGNGLYNIISKLTTEDGKELSLDIKSGKKENGANIQVWTNNGSQAQRFALLDTKKPTSNVSLEAGAYTLAVNSNTTLVADVASGSMDKGANLRLWTSNNSAAQSIVVTPDGEGYYVLGILKSAKVFDVEGGSMVPGANVRQWNYNGSDAQKWALVQNADGSYSFLNKKSGLYLSIQGNVAKSSNLRTYRSMGDSDAQKFTLNRIAKADKNVLSVGDEVNATGIYLINPAGNTGFVFDVKSGSKNVGGLIQLWASNGSVAQRFQIELVGDNEYKIRTASSGDYLTDLGNGVQLQQAEGTTWKIAWDNAGYFVFQNTASGRVIDVRDGSYAKGAAIQAAALAGKIAQHFLISKTTLVNTGTYYIKTKTDMVLDIQGGSTAAGANVRDWSCNKSDAQKFQLVKVGNYYQLINVKTGKAVTGGGAADSDGYKNVNQQTKDTSAKRQLWKIQVGNDGYIEFVNVASGKNLFSRDKAVKGANVVEKNLEGKDPRTDNVLGRSWTLEKATGWFKQNGHWRYLSDDSRAHFDNDVDSKGKSLGNYDILYTIWRYVNGKTSGSNKCFYSKTGYLICSSWDNCYVAIFKGKAKVTVADNWEPLFGLNCANGNAAKIEAQAQIDKPGTNWKWDPNWDRYLGEGNAKIGTLPEGSEWAYSLGYKPGESTAKGSYNWTHSRKATVNANEKWFTSVSTTLGYHTFVGGDSKESSQVGRHVSYGCQRLLAKYAKWIYDNIGPGTRCLQRTNKKLNGK